MGGGAFGLPPTKERRQEAWGLGRQGPHPCAIKSQGRERGGMDDDEFLSSLSPDQRRWYEQHHCFEAPACRSTPSASPSILEHSLCSEGSVSRQSKHFSRQHRSSCGRDNYCGDAATDASTPPHRVDETPVETPVDRTPMKTPLDTPLKTPAEIPRFTRHRREGLSYLVDLKGGIILDEDGKKVILRMHGLCSQVFRHHILNTWSEVLSELKDRVINMLHDKFLVSSRDESFNEDLMKWSMKKRDPTPYEHEYVSKKGLHALMDILTFRDGM
ncbi:hypothetical protein L7F22_015655, partial [Adiantum nelumboides]|nr:hypothetical protein [Adiantum nelumboides]